MDAQELHNKTVLKEWFASQPTDDRNDTTHQYIGAVMRVAPKPGLFRLGYIGCMECGLRTGDHALCTSCGGPQTKQYEDVKIRNTKDLFRGPLKGHMTSFTDVSTVWAPTDDSIYAISRKGTGEFLPLNGRSADSTTPLTQPQIDEMLTDFNDTYAGVFQAAMDVPWVDQIEVQVGLVSNGVLIQFGAYPIYY